MNQISENGHKLNALFEGRANKPYLCSRQVVTIAQGHAVRPGEEKLLLGGFSIEETKRQLQTNKAAHLARLKPISEALIDELYKRDTASATAALDKRLRDWKVKPLTDDQYTLFHDLAFNGGPGFLDGSIRRFLENGQVLDAILFAPMFCGVVNSAGLLVPIPGLTFRRYSYVWLALAGEAWRIGSEGGADKDWAEVQLFLSKLTAELRKRGRSNPLPYVRNTRAAQNKPLPKGVK